MAAACAGMGVAPGRPSVVEHLVRREELVIPFDRPSAGNISWCLVYPRVELPHKSEVLRAWLLRQAKG